MPFSILLRTVALFSFIAFAAVLSTLYTFNEFEDHATEFDGQCVQVAGIPRPEDIQVDFETRRVFVASASETGRGGIFSLSIDDPLESSGWRDLTGGTPEQFTPRGLHLYEGQGVRRLFVVNSAVGGVEIFDLLENGALVHLKTVLDRRLTSPSDVVGTGPESFYVVNNADTDDGSVLWTMKFIARARAGSILHFNGTSFRVAAQSLRFPSGIGINQTGDTLLVSETSGGVISFFGVESKTGHLTPVTKVSVNAGPDKLNLTPSGKFLLTVHPKPLKLAFRNSTKPADTPSLVMMIDPIIGGAKKRVGNTGTSSFEKAKLHEANGAEVFANGGDFIAGARVADTIDDKLVIGALREDKFLICDSSQG